MVGKAMVFVPGEEPGDYALGLGSGDYGRMAAHKLKMSAMPVGGEVAAVFPWWRTLHETVIAGDQMVLQRNGQSSTFANNSDHEVLVDEIRFYVPDMETTVAYQTGIRCKVAIPPKKEIVADWLPLFTIHTEIDRLVMANMDVFSYEMPSPYTLQRGNTFAMDFRYNAAFVGQAVAPDVYVIMAGLHGYGLIDGEPISLMKPVRGWPNTAGAANQWQTIVFDDEQGRPMRDAVITHISFGSSETTNIAKVLEGLEFRPHAPEGPAWHIGEFFAIRSVAAQVGDTNGYDYYCIHRPIVPYSLLPGERLQVEIWNSTATDAAIDVTLLGTQRTRG